MSTCKFEGCSNPMVVDGYCSSHYMTKKLPSKTCKGTYCEEEVFSEGYCEEHYKSYKTIKSRNSNLVEQEKPKTKTKPSPVTTAKAFKMMSKAILTNKGFVYQEGKTLDVFSDAYSEKQKGYLYKVCSVIECETLALGKGCCKKHLNQFKKQGTLTNDKDHLCTVGNCGRASHKEGYCHKHYENLHKYGIEPPKEELAPFKTCRIKGCKEEKVEDDFCKVHYEQYLEYEKAEKERLEKKAEETRFREVTRKFKEEERKIRQKEAEENRVKREEERLVKAKTFEEEQKLNSEIKERKRLEMEERKEQRRLASIANYIHEEGFTLDINSEEYKKKQESLDYRPCIVIGCTRKLRNRGCCKKHYHKHLTTGSLGKLPRKVREKKVKVEVECSVESCNVIAKTKGYCGRHYAQVRRYGRLTPELEIREKDPICKVEGCSGEVKARGYCAKHYLQIQRHGRLTPELERGNQRKTLTCLVDGCEGERKARGYCNKHYKQIQKNGRITDTKEEN